MTLHSCSLAAFLRALHTVPAVTPAFRAHMRAKRLEHRISQDDVAEVAGYSPRTITVWEIGRCTRHVEPTSVRDWVMALGILVREVRSGKPLRRVGRAHRYRVRDYG